MFDDVGTSYRNLKDPHLSSDWQPHTYGYWTEVQSHHMAGILAKWFYLLSEGGSFTNAAGKSFSLIGVGRAVAEQVALDTYLDGLPGNADFASAATQTLLTAAVYYDTSVIEAVQAAWEAVGVTFDSGTNVWEAYPRPGETGVDPWPAGFQVNNVEYCPLGRPPCQTAQSFQAEISEDNFVTTSAPIPMAVVGTFDGRLEANATANLEPGHVYFWRMKAMINGVWQTYWSFTGSFETSRKQPRKRRERSGAPLAGAAHLGAREGCRKLHRVAD